MPAYAVKEGGEGVDEQYREARALLKAPDVPKRHDQNSGAHAVKDARRPEFRGGYGVVQQKDAAKQKIHRTHFHHCAAYSGHCAGKQESGDKADRKVRKGYQRRSRMPREQIQVYCKENGEGYGADRSGKITD